MVTHGYICYPFTEQSPPGVGHYVEPQPWAGVKGGWYISNDQVCAALLSGEWFVARAPWNPTRWMCGQLGDMSPTGHPYPVGGGCGATDWSQARREFTDATGEPLPEQEPD